LITALRRSVARAAIATLIMLCAAALPASMASAGPATHFTVSAAASVPAGTAFSFTVIALDASNSIDTGYAGAVHFTSTDAQAVLPADFTMANGTGTFSATLRTAGAQTITATDTVTAFITGTSNTITVGAVQATQAIASAVLTVNHAAPLFTPVTGSGGTGALSYSISPSLPSGLTMAAGTGAITGTPTVASSATTYAVTVTDAASATATATFSLAVAAPALSVTASGSPATVIAGNDITYAIALTVSTATATTASLSDPLPAGLSFVSATAPAGWSCTTPAVGAGGTVTCSAASAAPGLVSRIRSSLKRNAPGCIPAP
jgi:uncharacterized repeat protein (TIGR01451 family)